VGVENVVGDVLLFVPLGFPPSPGFVFGCFRWSAPQRCSRCWSSWPSWRWGTTGLTSTTTCHRFSPACVEVGCDLGDESPECPEPQEHASQPSASLQL